MNDNHPRIESSLDEGERDAIWQYADPIWPAHYAWHPEEGWLYCTKSNRQWRPSRAGHDAVTRQTIICETDTEMHFHFVEVARFRAAGAIIFTPRGPVEVPTVIDTYWQTAEVS